MAPPHGAPPLGPFPPPGVRRRCHGNARPAPAASGGCAPESARKAPQPAHAHSASLPPQRRCGAPGPAEGGGRGRPGREGVGGRLGGARGPWRERPAGVATATAPPPPPPVARGSGRPRCAKCAGGFGNRRLRQPPPRARCGVIATVTRALGRRPIRWRELIAAAAGQSRPASIIQFSQSESALGEQGGSSWRPVA